MVLKTSITLAVNLTLGETPMRLLAFVFPTGLMALGTIHVVQPIVHAVIHVFVGC